MALKQVPVTVWDPSYTLPNWFGTWLDAHSSDCLAPKTVLKWDMFVAVAAFLAQAVLGMLAKVGTQSRTSVSVWVRRSRLFPRCTRGEAWLVACYLAILRGSDVLHQPDT